MQYTKQAISIDEQLELLQERGLGVDNVQEARDMLYRVSYFRLADYWRPMEADHSTRRFRVGAHFNRVLTLYRFDSELKVLLSRLYSNFAIPTAKHTVARSLGVRHYRILRSWMVSIAYLLKSIDPQTTFVADLKSLIAKYPKVSPSAMGFSNDWEQEPLWQ